MTRTLAATALGAAFVLPAALGAALVLPAAPASACIEGLCQPVLLCATFEWGQRVCV